MTASTAAIRAHVEWLRLRGLRETTVTARVYALRRVENATRYELLDLTTEILDAWQRQRLAEVGTRTRANE